MNTSNSALEWVAAALPLNWLFPNNQRKAAAMKTNELCDAIQGSAVLQMLELGFKPWFILPRLIGESPTGLVLIYQTLDSHRGLSRDTPLAGDGWRRKETSRIEVWIAATIPPHVAIAAKSAAMKAIPARELQGISKALCAG